uniref:Ig-like domain-containing protein n=1 Tax=Malurus cyaneus samueli TaxID=2593467 RepID=A0A8C5TTY2_9PASS
MPTSVVALREGQSTTFECQVVGTPEIHITWYLDGNEVTDQAKYGISFIDGLATLKVTQARVADSGIYVCEAHNDAGSESCSIDMRYFFSPQNYLCPTEETPGVLGSSALLECKVSGSPPITIAWFQNGLKLVSGEKHQISFSDNLCILEVNSLSHSDTGTYTCKATNVAGSDECSAVLTVQGGGHQSPWMSCQVQASLSHVLSEEPFLLRSTGLEGLMNLCQGTIAISTWRSLWWSLSCLM